MNKVKNMEFKLLKILMYTAFLLLGFISSNITVEAASSTTENQYVNLSNFQDWESGEYSDNGSLLVNRRRIRFTRVLSYNNVMLTVLINNKDFCLRVFEYDENMNLIKSVDLFNGDTIDVTGETRQFSFVLYRTYSEKSLSPGEWQKIFNSSLQINLNIQQTQDDLSSDISIEHFKGENFNLFSEYESGDFDSQDGTKIENARRIRFSDYLPIYKESLFISLNDDCYRIIIYEYDNDMNYLKRTDLGDGEVFNPLNATRKISFSLYRTYYEKCLSLGQWSRIIGDNLFIDIQTIDGNSTSDTIVKNENHTENVGLSDHLGTNDTVMIGTDKESVRKMLFQMLVTGDPEPHDIRQADMTYAELDSLWNDIIKTDGYFAYEMHAAAIIEIKRTSTGKVATVNVRDLDNVTGEAFISRCDRAKEKIAEVKAATQNMSELEKVLYVNEYIITHTTYDKSMYVSHSAGGALGEGRAVCEGYARACVLLLRELGMKADKVTSYPMNHAWVYVLIDGQGYHFDPTWDDTGAKITDINYKHVNFLRNDIEFSNMESPHYGWTFFEPEIENTKSTSFKYTNWFLHDVSGRVIYHDGVWFYVDPANGSIVSSKLDKSEYSVIINSSNAGLRILEISNGNLVYLDHGIIKSISI